MVLPFRQNAIFIQNHGDVVAVILDKQYFNRIDYHETPSLLLKRYIPLISIAAQLFFLPLPHVVIISRSF